MIIWLIGYLSQCCLSFVYLSRPYSWYRFSWIVPLVALAIIGMTNDSAEFYLTSPKFWGANFIALLVLLGFPFEKIIKGLPTVILPIYSILA